MREWNGWNAGHLAHATTTLHAKKTHTRRTDHGTGIKTPSWSYYQTRWFARQSIGVWFRKTFFDKNHYEASKLNPCEVTRESEQTIAGMYSTPEKIQDSSREVFPPTDGLYDGTDTDHYMEPEAEMFSEQPNPTPTPQHKIWFTA